MNDWRDRWVDSALQEVHGSAPPDLSARVLLALGEPAREALPRVVNGARHPFARWIAAAAALLLLGVAVGAMLARGGPSEARVVRLDLEVRTGALECIEAGAGGPRRSHNAAGSRIAFEARVGNRLVAAEPCRFQIGPFGDLATGPRTELEVKSMAVGWKHGVVAASSLTLAVVAGVVTWHQLSGASGTARAGEDVHLEAATGGGAVGDAGEYARLRQLVEQQNERIAQLEEHNANLQQQLAREPVAAAPVEEPPPPEPVVAEAVFVDERYADTLAQLDWTTMGEVTHEMGPMLVELAKAVAEGGEVPMELAAKIGALNAKLIAQLPALLKADLPGSGPNGAYTHPLVSANILAKTLDAAGLSMDAGQRDRIAGLVQQFTREAEAVEDSVQEFDLQKWVAEAETKDRFFREVASLLTPEQHRVMFPEGADQYDGTSLFHSSLFTRMFVDPVSAGDPAEFARSVANTYGEQLGLDEQASARIRSIVERMSGDPRLWQHRASGVETKLRMLKHGRADAALRQQVEIMREILRQVPMTEEQKKKFVAMKRLFVPLPE